MGKHVYVEKPMTHNIYEARTLTQLAAEKKVATQMGNQGHSRNDRRRMVEALQQGIIGNVTEVHCWTNRPIWPQGIERPAKTDPVPAHLHWDEWIGPAPMRPYVDKVYHDFKWRGWWDFGTGALGDMACHTFNMPFMALDLKNPTSIEAEHAGHNRDSYPAWSIIKFEFPSNGSRPAIPVTWYDGKKKPPKSVFGDKDLPDSGALVVGEKDTLHAQGDYCERFSLLSGSDAPDVDFPRSPGHFEEFVAAIKGGPAAMSNFPDYAGPLTETILLGNLAVWAGKGPDTEGKKLMWDSHNLRATNAPEVDVVIRRPYRSGWVL
jgi:predicted dehydrogenase